ncbi:MAG: tetratricopeptide repeat protein, partial [Myxococcales bacterium]
ALYRKAFALDHTDPVLLSAIKRAAERENDSQELLAALLAEAQSAGAAAAPIYYRIARVYDRLGKPDEARQALLAGQSASAEDSLILTELAQRYETAGEWNELAEVLRVRARSTSDHNELIAVNLRLGALCDEKLQHEDEAIACFRAVLQVAPTNASAITALGKLYHRRGNWEGLLETYEAEIATAEDVRLKAGRMYKSAELLETRLGRDEAAIARYREILTVVPGYLPATRALTRIFERTERYEDLIAMYELELTQTRDRDQVIALLSRIALVREERLKDLPGAAAALRRILDVAQDHLPTIRNLARVCERGEMWEELIRTNDLEASFAGDSKQVISLLHRNAEIYEEQLRNKDKAIEAYQKVLSLAPSYLPCLKALGRLYAQTGRWAELVDMYRQEAEVVPSTDHAAALIFKMGELYEEKLGQVDQAIASWQEVLTLSPSHFPALRALSRVYRAQQAWESLVDVLRAEAAARTDAAEKAHTLFQVGALWEDELANPALAIESYREVLQHV